MRRLATPEEAAAWIHWEPDLLMQRFPTVVAFWWDAEGRVWVETENALAAKISTKPSCEVTAGALSTLLEGGWEILAQTATRLPCGCYAVVRYDSETQEICCAFARRTDRFAAELRLPEEVVLTLPKLADAARAFQAHPHDEVTFEQALESLAEGGGEAPMGFCLSSPRSGDIR